MNYPENEPYFMYEHPAIQDWQRLYMIFASSDRHGAISPWLKSRKRTKLILCLRVIWPREQYTLSTVFTPIDPHQNPEFLASGKPTLGSPTHPRIPHQCSFYGALHT